MWTSHLATGRPDASRDRGQRGLGDSACGTHTSQLVRRVERGRVHRLHGGVVLVRIGVDRLDLLGRAGDRLLRVAVLVADERLLGVEAALEELGDGGARDLGVRALVPDRGSASSAVFACHQRSATTATALSPTFTTCLTPFMPCDLGGVEARELAAEHRAYP